MDLGTKIKKYRNLNNMTQQQLAEKLHVEHTTISNYEKNKRTPDYSLLLEMSKILGFSLDTDESESVNTKGGNQISRIVSIRHFEDELKKKYILFKVIISIVFVILGLFQFSRNLIFISIFIVIYSIIMIKDFINIFHNKTHIEHFNIKLNSKVYYEYKLDEALKGRNLTRRIFLNTFYLIVSVLLSTIIFGITNYLDSEPSLSIIYTLFILVIVTIFLIIIIRDSFIWNKRRIISYFEFQFKFDIFLGRVLIFIFDCSFMYVISLALFYGIGNQLSDQIVAVYLVFSLIYLVIGHDMQLSKLELLSKYKIQFVNLT